MSFHTHEFWSSFPEAKLFGDKEFDWIGKIDLQLCSTGGPLVEKTVFMPAVREEKQCAEVWYWRRRG